MQNGIVTSEDSWVVDNKAKHSLILQSSNCTSSFLPIWFETYVHTKNLHVNVYNGIIQNLQKLEVTKLSSPRWMHKTHFGTSKQWNIIEWFKKWATEPPKDRGES